MSNLTKDHVDLTDTFASRRYFKKFETITDHLLRVAAAMQAEGEISKTDVTVVTRYLMSLTFTFRALSMKYLLVGRDTGRFFGSLEMDNRDSGFPVAAELMTMANDAQQAATHLANMPSEEQLKDDMVRTIVGDRELPTKLQFALSQRLYYEELVKGELFWVQNDPVCEWMGNVSPTRRRFMLHWAVYDSQVNLPVIYMMELEDTGKTALPKDFRGAARTSITTLVEYSVKERMKVIEDESIKDSVNELREGIKAISEDIEERATKDYIKFKSTIDFAMIYTQKKQFWFDVRLPKEQVKKHFKQLDIRPHQDTVFTHIRCNKKTNINDLVFLAEHAFEVTL